MATPEIRPPKLTEYSAAAAAYLTKTFFWSREKGCGGVRVRGAAKTNVKREKKYIKISGAGSASEERYFGNIEVRVEGRFAPFNPYFVCNTANG